MHIITIKQDGLAHLSYMIISDSEAVVIDPRRDAKVYSDLALENGAIIRYIFETHRNEDYVIGSLELQQYAPTGKIGHSDQTAFDYGDIDIADGETFKIGSINVTALNTPGHTDDSMCYVVYDSSISPDPVAVFTGDTLFVNAVGRTDLVDKKLHEEMSRKLYHSLHDKVIPLGKGVIVYPAHGAGSVCGGAIASRDITTIGYELANNVWLSMEEEEFVEAKLAEDLVLAPYFKTCEKLNTIGPDLLVKQSVLRALDAKSFDDMRKDENKEVVDTREPSEFVKGYIPRAVNMSIEHMGLLAGWALDYNKEILLVSRSHADIETAWKYLVRVGLDNVIGFLANGMDEWTSKDKQVETLKTFSLAEIKDGLDEKSIQVVDVRQPDERDHDTIKDTILEPLTGIKDPKNLDKSKPIATMCPSGIRSTTAASILKRNGYDVGVPLKGIKGWIKAGYPTIN